MTTTATSSGVVAVSTPIRLASTVPLSSVSTTHPDSTPASRVPRSWGHGAAGRAELDERPAGRRGDGNGRRRRGFPGIDGLVERAETDENVPVGADEAGEARGEPAEDPPDGAGVLGH